MGIFNSTFQSHLCFWTQQFPLSSSTAFTHGFGVCFFCSFVTFGNPSGSVTISRTKEAFSFSATTWNSDCTACKGGRLFTIAIGHQHFCSQGSKTQTTYVWSRVPSQKSSRIKYFWVQLQRLWSMAKHSNELQWNLRPRALQAPSQETQKAECQPVPSFTAISYSVAGLTGLQPKWRGTF